MQAELNEPHLLNAPTSVCRLSLPRLRRQIALGQSIDQKGSVHCTNSTRLRALRLLKALTLLTTTERGKLHARALLF